MFIYGFGNPGRQDDGLGPAIIEKLDEDNIPGIITDSNYQLNIEDAHNISESETVIFVDASLTADEPFSFTRIEPSDEITFTTHTMSPQSVLALCAEIYKKTPEAYILAIKGYEWEFIEGLSEKADRNFKEAYRFLLETIENLRSNQ